MRSRGQQHQGLRPPGQLCQLCHHVRANAGKNRDAVMGIRVARDLKALAQQGPHHVLEP